MEQRNMLLAFALSIAILLGWGVIFPQSESEVVESKVISESPQQIVEDNRLAPELRPVDMDVKSIEQVSSVEANALKTFYMGNDMIRVGMDDRGWITEGELLAYNETTEPDTKHVSVLHTGEGHNVYVNAGILGHKRATPFKQVSSPSTANAQTKIFQATLDNGKTWQRSLSLATGTYIIHVEDRILNGGGMKMFRQVVERNPDKTKDTFYEHMGPTGLLNGELKEPSYDDLDETPVKLAAIGGWTGMMDRYFITALISQKDHDYRYYYKGDGRSYQAGVLDDGVLDREDAVFASDIYMGPKSIPLMKTLGVGLERSVDFGVFSFIAKPMHKFMMWMFQYVQNFGWCIILLVVVIKIIFFYPTHKAYSSMAGMRKIQPEMARLKELYGEDRQKMGQEMMKLYKKNKVNPMGGCLPILIQIPVFFALYKVLLMSIEMRQAPFIGWLQDLSVQDPYFILPVVMGISMFIQQKLNPQPADPMQAKIMQFLPPVFTIMFLFFPSGLVLYWVVNNTLAIAQQWYVMKKLNAI
ncbi:MAG: membrane protein insertase YidC [Mariprofundaceae bacterium]|nr:membrane protein insertase YidC [Mariprofundaceae bacterium]